MYALCKVLLESLRAHGLAADRLEYYLERHMEIDADHHGPMAASLMSKLCGHSCELRHAACNSAERSLLARVALWDGVLAAIEQTT
jgi:hypothetical protein